MRPRSRLAPLAGLAVGALMIAAACSSAATTPASSVLGATAVATPAAMTQAMSTMAPSVGANGGSSAVTLAEAKTTLGTFLTGANGMTLYFFSKDAAGKSNCTGQCATFWPPLTVAAGGSATGPADAMKGFGTITRDDGSVQVTYNQMPLYYFANDSAAGDTNGQGVQGSWGVALVDGTLNTAKAGAAATPAAKATPAPTQAGYSY